MTRCFAPSRFARCPNLIQSNLSDTSPDSLKFTCFNTENTTGRTGANGREDYMIYEWLSIFSSSLGWTWFRPGHAMNIIGMFYGESERKFGNIESFFNAPRMLTVISPAKTLDFESPPLTEEFSQPAHLHQSRKLMRRLRKFSSSDLSKFMDVSNDIADLNVKRNRRWKTPFTPDNAKQA